MHLLFSARFPFLVFVLPLTPLAGQAGDPASASAPAAAPAPASAEATRPRAQATFGAGCFWCVEAVYEQTGGVISAVSGYAGGKEKDPTYEQVSSGKTGHAEVVRVTFDPSIVSYEKLIDLFWETHDPTDPRGVAPDFGPHYRSILLYHDAEQLAAIERSRARAQAKRLKPIVTEVAQLTDFYVAEEYHQDFARRNPDHGYIRGVAAPKLRKLGLEMP